MSTNRLILFRLFLVPSLVLWLIAVQSVYEWNTAENAFKLSVSIEVNVPVDQAYTYLGNSENAKTWSVYVSSIETLNTADFEDGQQGSVRRCYVKGSENKQFWDEQILINQENRLRQLSIFNLNNFPLTAENLITEQRYFSNEDGFCVLEFSLFFRENARFLDRIKMHFASRIVRSIFEQNLQNIKKALEAKAHA